MLTLTPCLLRRDLKGMQTMDEKTLTALQGSIAKWQRILEGGIENGYRDCPLCELFFNDDEDGDGIDTCAGCPVSERAGMDCCSGTPYEEWSNYQWKNRAEREVGSRVFDEKSKQMAQSELDFLKSLLPSSPSAALDTSTKEK